MFALYLVLLDQNGMIDYSMTNGQKNFNSENTKALTNTFNCEANGLKVFLTNLGYYSTTYRWDEVSKIPMDMDHLSGETKDLLTENGTIALSKIQGFELPKIPCKYTIQCIMKLLYEIACPE